MHVTSGDLWSVFGCLHVHSFRHDGLRAGLRHGRRSSHCSHPLPGEHAFLQSMKETFIMESKG